MKLAERKSDGTKWAIKVIRKTSLGKGDDEVLKTEVTILEVGGRDPPSLELYPSLTYFFKLFSRGNGRARRYDSLDSYNCVEVSLTTSTLLPQIG